MTRRCRVPSVRSVPLAAKRNAGIDGERCMEWRIGIHLGDVLVEPIAAVERDRGSFN